MADFLGRDYWNQRYESGQTGWDLGKISPPLQAYIDQLEDKDISILIPGCGNAYEAEYLLQRGFHKVEVIDIAENAVRKLKNHLGEHTLLKITCGDFFKHTGTYDLILEQTFFCAIDPSLREEYVRKMSSLLVPEGKLVGLLFGVEFENPGPPFGGDSASYRKLFSKYYIINKLEMAHNSVKPRLGNELFFNFSRI